MKIVKIDIWILRVPLGAERFYSSQCAFPERNSFLLSIETDDGLIGWGEGGQYGPPEPVAACVEHVLGPKLIGRNPMDMDVIWNELYSTIRDFGQKGTYIEAMSAIDIALYDLTGKRLGVPVYQLLGGAYRDSVPTYATGCYYRGDDVLSVDKGLLALADEAKNYVDSGFRFVKMKVGLLSVRDDMKRVQVVREAIGETIGLMVDCNHAYNVTSALKIGCYLEEIGCLWMEEPVTPEDHEGYIRLRDKLSIPIAGGECEYTRYGFRDFVAKGCVDIVQADVCVSGGISEFRRIYGLASSYGTMLIPHVWGSGIAIATALHATAALPPFPHTANPIPMQNEPVLEYDRNLNPLREELLDTDFNWSDGRVSVPQGPGLGIEINRNVLEKYCVKY